MSDSAGYRAPTVSGGRPNATATQQRNDADTMSSALTDVYSVLDAAQRLMPLSTA